MISPNKLQELILDWLSSPNGAQKAFNETLSDGLFPKDDMLYALQHLKSQMEEKQLEEWAKKSLIKEPSNSSTLFLHAGNLPLVGFQDVVAALISGVRYVGKISKSDPHFLSNFLAYIGTQTGKKFSFSTSLEELSDQNPYQNVVFAGSESSAKEVVAWLSANSFVNENTRYLMRTAHVSIFYCDELKEKFLPELSDAMFRYFNKGCRNVGIIVSQTPLKSQSCALTDNAELFWMRAGVDFPQSELQRTYKALFTALDIPQIMLNNISIVQIEPDLSVPQTVFYVQGGEQELTRIIDKFGNAIQSVYTEFGEVIGSIPTEPISQAQKPPIWWKPDGVDILDWLCTQS